MGAIAKELVRSSCLGTVDIARNGRDYPPKLEGMVRRVEGTAFLSGFDNNCDLGQSRDDPVAAWETAGKCPLSDAEFGDQEAIIRETVIQRPVGRRVRDIDAGSEDADCLAPGFKGGPVSGRIYPPRHAAYNADSRVCHLGREGSGNTDSVLGRGAGANDGDPWHFEEPGVADQ